MKRRCEWAEGGNDLYLRYHDEEWGMPLHDDFKLFESLVLDGFQAGLSWAIILNKRDNFRRSFDGFDPKLVARYDDKKITGLLSDEGIIRNRRKIEAAVQNAKAFLSVQKEFGSFHEYIWRFVGGNPIVNSWESLGEIPAKTPESEAMSRDLSKRGFKFVGPTICYAFMQAVGMVNDHLVFCFRYDEIRNLLE